MNVVDLMREIILCAPPELHDIKRFVAYLTELGGTMPPDMRVRQLSLEQRAKHAAQLWREMTGTDVIPRSKILSLCGHAPGTVGAQAMMEDLIKILSLSQVYRAGSKNPALKAEKEMLYRIGDFGRLAMYEDLDGEIAEQRIRAFIQFFRPVKIRSKELAALVNVRHDRRFGLIFASVIQTMAKEYEFKIFRYRYGLNKGAVRKLAPGESRRRGRAINRVSRSSDILEPHRFAEDSQVMIAPLTKLLTSPGLQEIMYELTDRRPLHALGRAYQGRVDKVVGTGPLGTDDPRNRVMFMRKIAAIAEPYPQEFMSWWDTTVSEAPEDEEQSVESVDRRTVPVVPTESDVAKWIRRDPDEVQSSEISPPSIPEGCTLDANGVLRGPDGAKILRGELKFTKSSRR